MASLMFGTSVVKGGSEETSALQLVSAVMEARRLAAPRSSWRDGGGCWPHISRPLSLSLFVLQCGRRAKQQGVEKM